MADEPQKEPAEITPEQNAIAKAAFSGPAVYASHFAVSITAGGIRIAAVEQENPGKPVHFRTAIMTSPQEAIALWRLLERMLGDLEAQIVAAREAAQEGASGTTEDG